MVTRLLIITWPYHACGVCLRRCIEPSWPGEDRITTRPAPGSIGDDRITHNAPLMLSSINLHMHVVLPVMPVRHVNICKCAWKQHITARTLIQRHFLSIHTVIHQDNMQANVLICRQGTVSPMMKIHTSIYTYCLPCRSINAIGPMPGKQALPINE